MTTDLPALDCHAHIAPDVTAAQIADLGRAFIFAMTRSLDEARHVASRQDARLLWALGTHPGLASAREGWNASRFAELVPSFALVGEVGLDKRAGRMDEQRLIFAEMLALLRGQPMVVSIHSAGAEKVAVDMLERSWPSGVILHWFQGAPELVRRAVDLGAYFSVNAAMSDQQLARLPKERVLCETDFPSRRVKATIPGDVATAEQRLAAIWDVAPEEVRLTCWWNLRRIAETSGAIDRMPEPLANKLLLL